MKERTKKERKRSQINFLSWKVNNIDNLKPFHTFLAFFKRYIYLLTLTS